MSTSAISLIAAAAGGSFLLESREPEEVFTPEDLTEEQRQVAATAESFARQEILPALNDIEHKKPGLLEELMRKAAELGFTSIDVPEEYGGMDMDMVTSALVADHLSVLASFSTTFGAHVGIATLPLVWYGTEDQKRRYLPRLASCEWIGAYALSEASSGSDAMNIRTRATLSSDGAHYTLNGEKQWITNGGIAGLYTVFAKIVDPVPGSEKFSAFLIERGTPGMSIGAEEHKLGIRGSSTCPLVLQDCKVPAANLLGEAGKGHHIAFNVLNVGRLKLGVACVGSARQALGYMIRYANERHAFGRAIAEFGLIQRKISTCAARLFAAESMAYRTAGMIDASAGNESREPAREAGASRSSVPKWLSEYAVECSILKVYGSEMMNLVADELVAVMAGYGFVEEYPAERCYRDARINRIFEGTNEINRLIVTGWLMKRAQRGQLPLMAAIKKLMDAAMEPLSFDAASDSGEPLAREAEALAAMKKTTLFAAGVAAQRFAAGLEEQQEVMADLADMVIEVYAFESALLRARKLASAGRSTAQAAAAMTALLSHSGMALAEQAARRVVGACAEGDLLRTQLALLRRLSRFTPANTATQGRFIAQQCAHAERYPL
jgi:alkylation response protein AidB-like acyl-CoA dehydrogenase